MITVATNLKNDAAGQLFNYDFTGYCNLGGYGIGVSEDGLHFVNYGGEDFNTDSFEIPAYCKIATENFDVSNPKKIRSAYIQYESDGDIIVTLTPDEGVAVSYLIESKKTGQQRVRRRVKSRPRGTYWEVQIANVDGSDFGIDVVELVVQILNQGFI